MRKTSRNTIGGSLPWGLIGLLGLILTVEQVVILHDRQLTGNVPLNWRYSRNAAAAQVRDCEILCLGSSMVKYGIASRLIASGTGKRTFNLSMSASSLPPNYFVLRRALKPGARPKAVLIDCMDDGIEPFQIHNNLRNYPELLNIRETLDIAWLARDSDFPMTVLLSRVLPSLKTRFEIRNNVLAIVHGQSASSDFVVRLFRRHWDANRGTSLIPRNPVFEALHQGETDATLPQAGSDDTRGAKGLSGTYLRRFLDLAAAHGIRVFCLIPPVPPHTRNRWNRSGEDQQLHRQVSELEAHYPEMIVIDGRRSGYPVEAFFDDAHLNVHGATALSSEVATVMNRQLSGPRVERVWVTLPPYRERSPDPRLEDINASGLALRNSPGARR